MGSKQGAINLIRAINNAGFQAYLVGGCVRDDIMNREPHDYDICTSATPDQIKTIFRERNTYDVGAKFGTITVSGGDDLYEITTYRVDSGYADGRHPDSVSFTDDIEQDLSRRDLTINAMAWNPSGLVDPFGGKNDIENKIIRAVGDPDKRFKEDALRIMRAVRFSSRFGFEIEPETEAAMFANKGLLVNVSQERKTSEFLQIIRSATPDTFMKYVPIFSEFISELESIPKEDLRHNVELMSKVSDHYGKMTALFNGMDTRQVLSKLRIDHISARAVAELSREFSSKSKFEVTRVSIKKLMSEIDPDQTRRLIELKIHNHDLDNNYAGTNGSMHALNLLEDIIDKKEPYLIRDLKINGNDLIRVGFADKAIGDELSKLLDDVIENPNNNERQKLLRTAKEDKKKWIDQEFYSEVQSR